MNRGMKSFLLLSAGVAVAAAITVTLRMVMKEKAPVRQTMTVLAQRPQVEAFFADAEQLLTAAGSPGALESIDGVEMREAPAGRGVEVELAMRAVDKYTVKDTLRRAKALIEAGEVPTGARVV